jgi:hypothetical protein
MRTKHVDELTVCENCSYWMPEALEGRINCRAKNMWVIAHLPRCAEWSPSIGTASAEDCVHHSPHIDGGGIRMCGYDHLRCKHNCRHFRSIVRYCRNCSRLEPDGSCIQGAIRLEGSRACYRFLPKPFDHKTPCVECLFWTMDMDGQVDCILKNQHRIDRNGHCMHFRRIQEKPILTKRPSRTIIRLEK